MNKLRVQQEFNVTLVYHPDEKANELAFENAIRALLSEENGGFKTTQNTN